MTDREPPGRRVLIVGTARSGTTWLGEALRRCAGVTYVAEPDNFDHYLAASAATRNLGSCPLLRVDEDCRRLERLFLHAFDGRRTRSAHARDVVSRLLSRRFDISDREAMLDPARPRVPVRLQIAVRIAPLATPTRDTDVHMVKTVFGGLNIDWLAARFTPTIVLARRHPLDVLASWHELEINPIARGWGHLAAGDVDGLVERLGVPRPPDDLPTSFASRAWVIGLLLSSIDEAARTIPGAVVADHEVLCRDPVGELRRIARLTGLVWTSDADAFVAESNTPGTGYSTRRIAASLPGSWRQRLDPGAADAARRVLSEFEFTGRYEGLGA